MTGDETNDLIKSLHGHLKATEEMAIRTEANRWLGEAQAIAADLAEEELPEQAVEKRVDQVRELLSNIEETDNTEADERIQASLEVVEKIKK